MTTAVPPPTPDLAPGVLAAFAAQKAAVPDRRATFGLAGRRAALTALAAMVQNNRDAIVAALADDLGRHPTETLLADIIPLAQEIAHARRHLRRWMRPRRVRAGLVMLGTRARVTARPRGVALIVAPWNFPVLLALGPLASALAAGCSAVVKPSELTPATSALLARMLAETFPADLVAVAEGGAAVAAALTALPFDHIFFTGSPETGRKVMAAAAQSLASVTLELGGKSPVLVGPDADIGRAARWIAWGRFFNAGQTCVAPDHVIVHESRRAALVAALVDETRRMFADPAARTRIVSPRHWRRLRAMIDAALAGGAGVALGGGSDEPERRIEPTILTGAGPGLAVTGEEIFGPVLPVAGYADLSEAIARINAAPPPLALYVFGNKALADEVTARTASGSVGVNLTVMPFIHTGLPFGGVGASGIGAAHGHAGFLAFSHERPVLENRFLAMPLLFPPYGPRVRRLAGMLNRLVR